MASWSELEDRQPAYALVGGVDLVVIRFDDAVSVLYGRCQHRDAIMADGHIDGRNLICGVHGWDYQYETGVSEYAERTREVARTACRPYLDPGLRPGFFGSRFGLSLEKGALGVIDAPSLDLTLETFSVQCSWFNPFASEPIRT